MLAALQRSSIARKPTTAYTTENKTFMYILLAKEIIVWLVVTKSTQMSDNDSELPRAVNHLNMTDNAVGWQPIAQFFFQFVMRLYLLVWARNSRSSSGLNLSV